MLRLELAGATFNKAERNRELRERLGGRSSGFVEFKHENISAVLQAWNLPFVRGYKPASNYQRLLEEVTLRYLERHPGVLTELGRSDFAVTAAGSKTRRLDEIFDDPPLHMPAELVRDRERTYVARSEERRVGKESRSRWSPSH